MFKLVFVLILFLPLASVYGDISGESGEYFCNIENVGVEKRMYKDAVNNINGIVDAVLNYQGKTIEELNEAIVTQSNFEEINKVAECLQETHGVDPDTVAKFSEPAKEVLSYNMQKLAMVAPDLVNYAEVPEFGTMTLMVLVTSIVFATLFVRKFQVR